MSEIDIISGKKHQDFLDLLGEVRVNVKNSDTYKDVCKEKDVDEDFIDFVPMCFAKLDVSARTENGIIYFNVKLLQNKDDIEHYMIHEFNHVLQQCLGDGPTEAIDRDNYLDDKNEKESFQYQADYIEEVDGSQAANDYVNQVLDHHDINGKERDKRKKQLLAYKINLEKFAKKIKDEALVRLLVRWSQKKFASYVLYELTTLLNTPLDDNIRWYIEQTVQECLKYTNEQFTERTTCIPFSLFYLLKFDYFENIIGKGKQYKNEEEAYAELIKSQEWQDEIPLCLEFIKKGDTSASGHAFGRFVKKQDNLVKSVTNPITKNIVLYFNVIDLMQLFSVERFRITIEDIAEVLRHELQHLLQMIYYYLYGTIGSEEEKMRQELGSAENELGDSSLRISDLDDIEFRPRLFSEIDFFNRNKGSIPSSVLKLAVKHILGFNVEDQLFDALYNVISEEDREYIREKSKEENVSEDKVLAYEYFPFLLRRTFFRNLRKYDYRKWRIAANEFLRETETSI